MLAVRPDSKAQELLDVIHDSRAFQLERNDHRLWLEARPLKMVDWAKRERWLCTQDTGWEYDPNRGFPYWVERYGWIQRVAGGDIEPMEMFEAQRHKMVPALVESSYVAFGKSRRFGATTIDTHHTGWLMALSEATLGTRYFASSNTRENAQAYAERVKEILRNQPPWLSVPIGKLSVSEDGERGDESKTVLEIAQRRVKLTSVAASGALRSVGARKYVADEAAFPPPSLSPERWIAAALPTKRGGGQCVFISTGDGDQNTSRPGRAFGKLVRQGQRGEGGVRLVFISRDEDPNFKMEDWEAVAAISGEAAANAEYPRTVDDMLRGDSQGKTYDSEHVRAAVELGRLFRAQRLLREGKTKDEIIAELASPLLAEQKLIIERLEKWLPQGPLPDAVSLTAGYDWGQRSATVVDWRLGSYRHYICADYETSQASLATEDFVVRALAVAQRFENRQAINFLMGGGMQLDWTYPDAEDTQKCQTLETLSPPYTQSEPIPFGSFKRMTVDYLRLLLLRSYEKLEAIDAGEEGPPFAFIAIDPVECTELPGQLYTLEVDKTGAIVKGGDHTHDALIANLALDGVEYRENFS